MSYRKSLKSPWWRRVTKKQFIEFAKRFEEVFEAGCKSKIERKIEICESVAELEIYLKYKCKKERERNEKGIKTLWELKDIPERVRSLPYICLTLRPYEKGAPPGALGIVTMSAVFSPGRIVFYTQPAEVDRVMEDKLFPGEAPKGFKFGDGFEL